MRVRALPAIVLLLAAGLSILVGALTVGLALPVDQHESPQQISATQVADAEAVAPNRRPVRALARWVEVFAPPPTVGLLGSALLAVAGATVLVIGEPRTRRTRQYLAWSLRSPPLLSV
jgi:hypothetical protein